MTGLRPVCASTVSRNSLVSSTMPEMPVSLVQATRGVVFSGVPRSPRASPLAENLVRDARVCQGRQGRLLLSKRAEVQHEVRDVRLQRCGEPRRRRSVANRLRAEGVDRRRRGKDYRAREESGELRSAVKKSGLCW
jgi:hypothetical protein